MESWRIRNFKKLSKCFFRRKGLSLTLSRDAVEPWITWNTSIITVGTSIYIVNLQLLILTSEIFSFNIFLFHFKLFKIGTDPYQKKNTNSHETKVGKDKISTSKSGHYVKACFNRYYRMTFQQVTMKCPLLVLWVYQQQHEDTSWLWSLAGGWGLLALVHKTYRSFSDILLVA